MKRYTLVEFTKSGWRQFAKLNRALGTRFIRAFILEREVAVYIAAHEARLDTECQELRYDDGIYLLMKRIQDVWYITDVFATEPAAGFAPVHIWQRIRMAFKDVLRQVLVGWRAIKIGGEIGEV